MATVSEIQSLEDIRYKSKLKIFIYPILLFFVFTIAFLHFYPISTQLKSFMKKNLAGTGCNPDYDNITIGWLLPKVIITDLSLPSTCFGQNSNENIRFNFVTINFNFINFSPFGLPFKIETEMNAQPLSLYFVQGISERLIRVKDQSLVFSRIKPLIGDKLKISGNMVLDFSLLLTNNNSIQSLELKVRSKDLQLPAQNLQGFTTPNLKLNDLYLEATSGKAPRILIEKFLIGDTESPIRANFKGHVDMQQGNLPFSPMDLTGEMAFSENLKQQLPLIDIMFQTFAQVDGFYQIRLGGMLGSPKALAP